jgi:hypothetical protein
MNKLRELKLLWNKTKLSPIFPIVMAFILITLINRGHGGTNEMSRMATLRAMSIDHTFTINPYKDWTMDWARKDQNYFSNKAPGPAFIAFPLFFISDQFIKAFSSTSEFKSSSPGSFRRTTISFIHQLLPYVILCLLIVFWMKKNLYSNSSIISFSVMALYGNTNSLLMNSYFGHGQAALFTLAMFFSLRLRKYTLVGLFFGMALLTEYSAALLLPGLIIFILYFEKKLLKSIKDVCIGGVMPGILWCWYHYSITGSIFSIPAKYQNPEFLTQEGPKELLYGIFSFPDPYVILELLFGTSRGLLFTQPWFLVVLVLPILLLKKIKRKEERGLYLYSLFTFTLLVCVNASFNNWHAGAIAGPRYISLIFPASAFVFIFAYDQISQFQKKILFITISISVIFFILIQGATVLAPPGTPVWTWAVVNIQKLGFKAYKRVILTTIILIITFFRVKKKLNQPKTDYQDTTE